MHSPSLSLFLMIRFSFFFIFFILFLFPTQAQQTILISPVSKDKHTNLFTLSVYLKTPLRPTKLFLDLSFLFPWIDCDGNYNSSSFRQVPCDATFCESLGFGALSCANCTDFTPSPNPNCVNIPTEMVCGAFPENPVTKTANSQAALIDTLALPITNGDMSPQGQLTTFPNFTFSCAHTTLLKRLPKGVTGLASLGRSNLSIQDQISSGFSTSNCLAICLPGSPKSTGVAFFGSCGPYYASPEVDITPDLAGFLVYTPLIENPVGSGDTVITYVNKPSNQYFIGLTSVRVNGKQVPINSSLLSINKENGFGGTKISSATPYTLLESSIYKAFTELFVKEASSSTFNLTTVSKPVKPFSVCYSAERVRVADGVPGVPVTYGIPVVPSIDLVLDRDDVVWKIDGANSMVRVTNKKKELDLWCLGFVDGGVKNKASIVIGGKQLEENLVQFDLENNRFGFTSSLASHLLSCADFRVVDFAK